MKINIVKDSAGKVVATFENASGGQASISPEADSSHTIHEIEVADNYLREIDSVYKLNSK